MDTERHLDAHDALALAAATEQGVRAAITPSDRFSYAVWAIVWPLGFMALWFTFGDDPIVDVAWIGSVAYVVCISAGVVATWAHFGVRMRGVVGSSSSLGRNWALVWLGGFAACLAVTAGIDGVVQSDAAMDLIAVCLATFTVGMIYTATGAVIGDAVMTRTGLWLLATCVVAALVGPYGHLVVIAVGGVIGFGAAAITTSGRQ